MSALREPLAVAAASQAATSRAAGGQLEQLVNSVSNRSQDLVLFNDTIAYNIQYGRLDATQAEVEDAARQVRPSIGFQFGSPNDVCL